MHIGLKVNALKGDHIRKSEDCICNGSAGPPEKRDAVAAVISASGFKPQYVGPIRYARNLEAIAELWHHLAIPSWGDIPPEVSIEWGYNFHFQVISDRN